MASSFSAELRTYFSITQIEWEDKAEYWTNIIKGYSNQLKNKNYSPDTVEFSIGDEEGFNKTTNPVDKIDRINASTVIVTMIFRIKNKLNIIEVEVPCQNQKHQKKHHPSESLYLNLQD